MKTNVALSKDLLAAVDRLAEQLEISRYDLIRKALERYLEQEGARVAVLAAAGRTDFRKDW